MADVNLSVAVAAQGVSSAIAQLESLRSKGLQTGSALKGLAEASSQAMSIISQTAAGTTQAVQKTTQYGQAIGIAKQATKTFNQELRAQVQQYESLAKLDPMSTARSRLTRAGGVGGLAGGLAIATNEQNRLAAQNVSILRDKATVEAQIAAQTSANAALEKGRWENSLLGMTQSQRAQAVLTRATQEYNLAVSTLARTTGALNGQYKNDEGRINARINAVQQLTVAERNLAVAQQESQSTNSFNSSNAFQSSYSYFIIAGLATQAAAAIRDSGVAAVEASSKMERSFVDVDRTSEGTTAQLEALRAKLIELSTSTPISFIDLSQIAALGNQLGIAAQDIESFTQTIAQYSAISGQSAEDAATAFGRISNLTQLPASQFSNLASSIEYVARTSVATESSISSAAKEISALAAGAGFSAQGIVGLAGALSSLAIPPERARGALSLYFGALNSAIAEGGPKLEAFATLLGTTTGDVSTLVRDNKGQEVFTKFITGLSNLDSVAKTSALDTLGLSTIRVDQTMRALAQNVPLVTSVMQGANRAFSENTELGRQYSKIQATFDSVWKELTNSITNAAGAVGNNFLPALKDLFQVVTKGIVAFSEFANSPIGKAFLTVAGSVAVLVAAITGLIGALALMKASLVVAQFAFAGLESHALVLWLKQVTAGLFTVGTASKVSATGALTLRGALVQMGAGAKAAALGMGLLKIALPLIALTALVAGIQTAADALEHANNPAKFLGDSVSSLNEAMKEDNPTAFSASVIKSGEAARLSGLHLEGMNKAVGDAVVKQHDAAGAVGTGTSKIDAQTLALGKATKAWIANAVIGSDAMKKLIEGPSSIFDSKSLPKETLSAILEAGFDFDKFSTLAYTKGKAAALKYATAWVSELDAANPSQKAAFDILFPPGRGAGVVALGNFKNALGEMAGGGVAQAKGEAILTNSVINAISGTAEEATQQFDAFGNVLGTTTANLGAAEVGFRGSVSALADFQDGVQGAMKDFTSFENILKESGKDSKGNDIPVTITGFGKSLSKANSDATKFFTNITTLAGSGSTAFAAGLADLGPDAQDILAQAMKLSPEARGALERDARFAAFLSSDAFKQALQENLSSQNDAYARIFSTTGSLADVRSFIAAQVAGTAEEWERQWDVKHPTAPLNVKILDPSDDELKILGDSISGRLTITANVTPVIGNNDSIDPTKKGIRTNTFTDTVTKNSLTLPASLNGDALTASLTTWMKDQSITPAKLQATLNTEGLNLALDQWRLSHGPIRLDVVFGSLPSIPNYVSQNDFKKHSYRNGGEVSALQRFASGGMLVGPGSGTSDSMLVAASNGEYFNTASSTKFWGADFFDSLNKKMLPTSFIKLLGAAAVSGNQGPQSVTNVQLTQNYPQTVHPLKKLSEDSERLVAGIW